MSPLYKVHEDALMGHAVLVPQNPASSGVSRHTRATHSASTVGAAEREGHARPQWDGGPSSRPRLRRHHLMELSRATFSS